MTSPAQIDTPASRSPGAAPSRKRAGAALAPARAGRDRVSAARRPDNHVIAVFGATGDRWAGVLFILRSGRRLAASRQLITLGFHEPPLRMFPAHTASSPNGRRNEIVIDFADPGSITASFLAKEPGATMRLGAAEMTFRYANSFDTANGLDGYERLLLEAMLGDQSLFTTAASVERLWEASAPLLENPPPIQPYPPAPGAHSQHSTTSPPPTTGTYPAPAHPHRSPKHRLLPKRY